MITEMKGNYWECPVTDFSWLQNNLNRDFKWSDRALMNVVGSKW